MESAPPVVRRMVKRVAPLSRKDKSMQDEYAPEDVHRHGCDCVACWTGMTINGPKPPTRWQRFYAWLTRAALAQGKD